MTDSPECTTIQAAPALPGADQPALGTAPAIGNLADYRWVPVRRRPRYDGWTEEKQRRFIEVLADTGIVGAAAKAVGMTRESAYKLRRSPGGAAFARAWDAARHHAGGVLEDVAFERAIEGVEHHVFDEYGEVVCTRRVPNDRMLMFLLRHLKPDRYARDALCAPAPPPPESVEETLRAMEPQLPASAAALLDAATLADEIELAEAADGTLPHFLTEQRPAKTASQRAAEELARGKAAAEKQDRGEALSKQDLADMCHYLDPTARHEKPRKRYR